MNRGPLKVFVGPKSICKCGHLGDGEGGDHEDGILLKGHGRCKICDCKMFEWKKFVSSFEELVDRVQRRESTDTLEKT
jgi:hypothetical protein